METRMGNIFKTKNVLMLTQTILQSPYQAPLNDPYFYLRALKFLVASNVQIVITFALFWQNQSNYIFQKVRHSLSKRDISRFCCHTVIYAFWRFFFFFLCKIENVNRLVFTLRKTMGKDSSWLKTRSKPDYTSSNFEPSNLLFPFTDTCLCHLHEFIWPIFFNITHTVYLFYYYS